MHCYYHCFISLNLITNFSEESKQQLQLSHGYNGFSLKLSGFEGHPVEITLMLYKKSYLSCGQVQASNRRVINAVCHFFQRRKHKYNINL